MVGFHDFGAFEPGGAISANFIISTAPMAKLAATTQLGEPAPGPTNRSARSATSCSVNPVVPTTAWMPASAQNASVVRAASTRVKSTITSVWWRSVPRGRR